MINLPDRINLTAATGELLPASVVPLAPDLARDEIDGKWWQELGYDWTRLKAGEVDAAWQWAPVAVANHDTEEAGCIAVRTDDGRVHGACLFWYAGRLSQLTPGKMALEVALLATAPRNRPWLVSQPAVRGAGSALLQHVVAESVRLGLEGRVVLDAYNDPRTVSFYLRRGFQRLDADPGDMMFMELGAEAAIQLQR